MKFEPKKEKLYQPIVITLETRGEAKILKTICGMITGYGRIREFVNFLYDNLKNHVGDDYNDDIKHVMVVEELQNDK